MSKHANLGPAATRRQFLRTGASAMAGTALISANASTVHAAGTDALRIALVGCGARGAGAAVQALSTSGSVQLWSMADAFQDRLENCLTHMKRGLEASYDRDASGSMEARIDVPPERRFTGLDAYRKAIDSGVDVVLLIEPPGFRPAHFQYAINAGKHVFMEKPVATDVAGVRSVLKTAEEAKAKGLKVGVGLQRHYQDAYQQGIQRVHDGEIGDVMMMRCYWNGGLPAKTPHPRGDMSELEYQVRNWYFFTWLGGDHICEQHVHNLDVCNWVKQAHPVKAQGQGGRQVRTGKQFGNIFDHHAVEFTYADGAKMFSQCRQMLDCWRQVGENVHGRQGTLHLSGVTAKIVDGDNELWKSPRPRGRANRSPYQIEHDALFKAIRENQPHNEAEYGATSTMTAILGRMATYTGNVVTWDEAFNSGQSLTTDAETWESQPPVSAEDDGSYAVAVPGVTKIA